MEEQVIEKNYILKLTISQLWPILVIVGGLFSTIYFAGIKTEAEVKKVELLKQEQQYQNKLSEKDNILIESSRKLKEATEDLIYYKGRYELYLERFNKCVEINPFIKIDKKGNIIE